MENYILQILESSTRVIVPEFGAFIVKQRNPLTVVFNEFLQYNDGVLVDVIAKNEDISRNDAKKKIDEYVDRINQALENGESFSVGKLGVIVKGGLGKISLEKEDAVKTAKTENERPAKKAPAAKKKAESKIEVTIPAEDIVKIEPIEISDKKQAAPVKEDKPEVKSSSPETKQAVTEVKKAVVVAKQEVPESIMQNVVPEEKKPQGIEIPKTQVVVPEKKELINKDGIKPLENFPPQQENNTNKYKKTNVIVWVIIILVINILIIGYFIYSDELKGIFTQQVNDTLAITPIVIDEIAVEEVPVGEPTITEEPDEPLPDENITEPSGKKTPEAVVSASSIKYYIVAGVFRDENNADKLVKELNQKGFKSEKFGRLGNLHAVSYNVFSTKQEADLNLIKIRKETDPEAWIRRVE
jgi:nucleoid DNA-binding protein